jgi:nucleoside-diphosphate-sugar epimerase
MRVLVTGGTGFVASHLLPALLRSGHEVRALVLPSAQAALAQQDNVECFAGDVREPGSLSPAMDGVEAVFHLAAAIGVRRPMREYHAINVIGTENVCRAALAARVKRLVHMSSTSVYPQGLGVPVREDFPLNPPPDPYAVTKAAAEARLQRMIAEERLPASVVRTGNIYGPGDRLNFGRIADRVLTGRSIVIGSGRNRVPFTYVEDVVDGLLRVLEHEEAEGQIYNITDDRPPTQEELLREVAEQLGATPPHIHIPYRFLYSAGWLAELVARITGSSHPLVTRFGVAMYGADNCFVIDKARRQLGYEPRVHLSDGVSRAAEWYRAALADPETLASAVGVLTGSMT